MLLGRTKRLCSRSMEEPGGEAEDRVEAGAGDRVKSGAEEEAGARVKVGRTPCLSTRFYFEALL